MNMNTTIKRVLPAAVAIGLVSIAFAQDVSARSLGGGNGRAQFTSEETCFNSTAGRAMNNCSFNADYEVVLPVDASGGKSATIVGQGVTCTLGATNSFDSGISTSATVVLPSGSFSSQTLSGVTVPGAGKMWLGCTFVPGGQLIAINYNQ